jgi:hypothetical protein
VNRLIFLALGFLISLSVCCAPFEAPKQADVPVQETKQASVSVQEPPTFEQRFQEAKETVQLICRGCNSDAVLVPRPSYPATAEVDWRDIIVFNPIKLRRLQEKFGSTVDFVIFAHENGHIVYKHVVEEMDQKEEELFADSIAGCATAIRGYDPAPGFLMLMSFDEDKDHPPGEERAQAFLDAYKECK